MDVIGVLCITLLSLVACDWIVGGVDQVTIGAFDIDDEVVVAVVAIECNTVDRLMVILLW